MKPLQTINANGDIPTSYEDRLTVKAIIFNDQRQVLLFSNMLPGGGVEEGETLEQAIHRECLEEVGATVEIIRELGFVEQYRDALQKRYEVHGFLVKIISQNENTTTQEDEVGKTSEWKTFPEAISLLEDAIKVLEEPDKSQYQGDTYQSKLYNRQTAVVLLREAEKFI